MVRNKKTLFLIPLLLIILLGIIIPSNIIKSSHNSIPINNPSYVSYQEEQDFNISYESTELTFKDNYTSVQLVGIPSNADEVFLNIKEDDDNNKYIIKNIKTNEESTLYESKDVFATALAGAYEDNLYIVETSFKDDKLDSYVILVDRNKNVSRHYIGSFDKIPYVQQIENGLLINTEYREENEVNTSLFYLNLNNFKRDLIIKEQYKENSSENITGSYVLYGGGMDNTIYYQVVEYNEEELERDGKSYIYKVNKNNLDEHIKVTELEEKLLFLSGDEDSLITSDYIYDPPFYDSGKLFIKGKDNWTYTTIPNVTAGNNIIGSEKIDDSVLLIYNNQSYYLYDYKNKKYKEEIYNKNPDSMYSRLKSSNKSFLFLENMSNKFFLHKFKYID